ncbi:hypothetical protein AB0F46_42190 [Streptomyces sp. NPDC026665]|uniref:hypothetical protein n=1 Tax=Streptomyces sp. NPDC026665 TaxID=3154798 RepID=UPI0033D46B93
MATVEKANIDALTAYTNGNGNYSLWRASIEHGAEFNQLSDLLAKGTVWGLKGLSDRRKELALAKFVKEKSKGAKKFSDSDKKAILRQYVTISKRNPSLSKPKIVAEISNALPGGLTVSNSTLSGWLGDRETLQLVKDEKEVIDFLDPGRVMTGTAGQSSHDRTQRQQVSSAGARHEASSSPAVGSSSRVFAPSSSSQQYVQQSVPHTTYPSYSQPVPSGWHTGLGHYQPGASATVPLSASSLAHALSAPPSAAPAPAPAPQHSVQQQYAQPSVPTFSSHSSQSAAMTLPLPQSGPSTLHPTMTINPAAAFPVAHRNVREQVSAAERARNWNTFVPVPDNPRRSDTTDQTRQSKSTHKTPSSSRTPG